MLRKAFLNLLLVLSVSAAWGQQRYIYLHKNAADENSSPDFNFTVTGPGGFNQTYTLNDQHTADNVRDLGATSNGRLWAIVGNGADAPIYYRDAGSSSWQLLPGGAAGINIDGGPDNANIHSNSAGEAHYYDGATFYNTGATRAGDVAMDKSNNRVFHVKASGSDAGDVYQKIVSTGTWNLLNNVKASRIDVAPNGDLVSASLSPTNGNVYLTDFNGNNVRNLGDPGNTGTAAVDVAVGEDGVIYAIKTIFDGAFVYRYNGGYAAGGTWTQEPSSRQGYNITGGPNGQMWNSEGNPGGTTYRDIYTRTSGGFWIDDEPVKTTASNVVMIPVPSDGAYTITENPVSGWALGAIDVYDPNNNTTAIDIANRTVIANVESGEVVHVVYKNQLIQTFTIGSDCASAAYLETFGTGIEPTVGAALTGQTNYHYLGIQGETIRDGYYTIASNSIQPGFGEKGGDFKDHTAGDGTGRMMLVNASYDKGIFFHRRFNGLLPGVAYSFSAWLMNISNTTIKPNVLFQVVNPVTGQVLASHNTGDITSFGQWIESQLLFTATLNEVDLILSNNNIGGEGNDLALDDIKFSLATPTTPIIALGDCNGSTKTLQITSPLGSSYEYSIDGVNYQASPAFEVGVGTYPVTARYVGSIGGCVTAPVSQVVNLDDCLSPFSCSNLAYQVSGPSGGNSSLYSYDVATGNRTLLGNLPIAINAIGYNPLDNYIWGVANGTNQVVKLGSNVQYSTFTIPNLPAATGVGYNVGEFIGDGYLFLYSSSQPRYYVVDVNPARPTYLQLVDPTASYSLDNAPYGNTFSGTTGIAISDLTYSTATGLLYGIVDAGASAAYKLVTVNPVTRVATASANAISGGGIQGETSGYGSAFIDQSANNFYVFANTLGQFFRINLATNTAAFVSTSVPAGSNDGASCPNAFLVAPTAFACEGLAYQVTSGASTNSNLYSYNVATGTRALLGELTVNANAIGYNTLDNFLWGLVAGTNRVVKIGSNGSSQVFDIPNLPNPSAGYNVGDFIGDGYLFFYDRTETRYYVVDLNPARGTYLQLVDPTASFALDTAPYGNAFSIAPSILNLSDLAYNPATGLLYGLTDPTSALPFRSVTVNPLTSAVTFGTAVSGGGIQGETAAYGSIFIDQNADGFYAFANTQGKFYRINSTTNTAALISTSVPALNNDGASCPDAFLTASIAGNVFHDPDAGNVGNSTGSPNTVPSGLFANLVGTDGNVVAVAPVNGSGAYGFNDVPAGNYTVVLSTTSGSVGTTAPAPSLPAGWANTGEFNGAENTGNTAPVDGVSAVFTVGVNSTDVNFGIQQPPVADVKTFILPVTPAANSTIQLGLGGDVNSGSVPGNLTGNDPDGGVLNSTTAPYGVTINSLPANGVLIYDGTPVTTPGFFIANYDPTKLEFQFTGSGYSDVSFSYSVHDEAGFASTPATYAMQWTGTVTETLVSGSVFHDADGGNVNHSASGVNTVPSGLYANLVGTNGNVVAVAAVNADGTYQFTGVTPGDYTVVLSTTSGSIGAIAPAASLPTGWANTGEFNGAENTGNTAPVDGISPVFTIGVNSTDVNFGIQQPPVADPKTYTVPNAAFSFTPVATYPAFPDYMAIQASSANLTGYPTGGSLSGSDAEDCPAGECNTGTGTTFNIVSIEPTTRLYYDFGAGPVAIDVTGGPVSIPNFDVTKLVIYGAVGSGTGTNPVGFTYSITDKAGATSAAASYTVRTEGPMPVTLISFDALREGQTVNLVWATSTEENSKGFEIERSSNASTWSKIGFVASQSPEMGSANRLDYRFTDPAPLKGTSYYRLKMIDFDQSFAYSQIRSVNREGGQGVTLYPNPVSKSLLVKDVPNGKVGRVMVHDLAGREVIDQQGMPAGGIDVSRLPAGTYIVDIQLLDGNHTKHKIVVAR